MQNRYKYLKISTILGYVFAFIYALATALLYSVGESTYWFTLVLMVITLANALFTSYLNNYSKETGFVDKFFAGLIINTILYLTSPISLIFNICALCVDEKAYEEALLKGEEVKKPWYKKSNFILAAIGLVTVVLSSLVAQMGETSFYTVEVNDFTLTKAMTEEFNAGEENALNGENFVIESDALHYSVTEYKPKTASLENPLPVVFVMPGFTRTKATMAQYAIEFSRRGAVVFTIDPGSQGGTTYSGYDENGEMISSTVGANGLDYLVQYVYNNVDRFYYIDRNNIGAIGHSAGGGNACQVAEDFAGDTYEESIIKALYVSGYIRVSAANRFKNLRCNAALSYAYYDEGAFRFQGGTSAFEVIAQRFIDEVNGNDLDNDPFVIDQEYGSMEEGTYRVIHKEATNHCFQMYDSTSISNTINFFRRTLNLNTTLADSSQMWFLKEGFNGLALVGAFVFVFALLAFVIDVAPLFKSFKKRVAQNTEYENTRKVEYGGASEAILAKREDAMPIVRKKKSFADKLSFWLVIVVTAIIACLDYIPLARLSMDWFPDAASNTFTFYFPARMMNAVMLWAVVNGLIGLVLCFGVKLVENLIYIAMGKKEKVSWYRFTGLRISLGDLLKSLLLAVCTFAVFYGLDELINLVFHQDFRFMLISASPLEWRFVVTWAIYLVPFFIFYFSNSVRVNLSIATEGWKEWQVYLVGALANSIGLVFILIINYYAYFTTGTPYYGYYSATDTSEMWLYINMVFPLIPMMALLPILNRFIYKKSGNVYLGALVCCMIFIMMSLSASVSYIPL